MHIKFPGQKGAALSELEYGESLLVPCNDSTVQSVQSSIQSLYAKKHLVSREFSQRKALLVFDEHVPPVPVIVVTRQRVESLEEVPA
ncbi:hypothetical protein BRCH_00239c [Candidatus Burkholderia brachyanthoides]|nr:hypothetical protein BRCH_00239c [Candidatus Burkholderia brachyanthoides]